MRLYRWKPRIPHPSDPEAVVGENARAITATPYGVLVVRLDGSQYLSRFEGVGELDERSEDPQPEPPPDGGFTSAEPEQDTSPGSSREPLLVSSRKKRRR